MTLEELTALYRAQSQDTEEPYFCSNELLAMYASEAQEEACRRGMLLRDAASPLCTVNYALGDETIALDARIVKVIRAFVDGYPVDVVGESQMDAFMPTWHAQSTAIRPSKLVAGVTAGRLHLWPIPSQAGQIKLHVLRLPLKRLVNDTDKPEIRQEAHPALVEWMLYRAYSRDDADLGDPTKAATALRKFVAEFGDKHGARNEQWVRDSDAKVPGPIV